MIASIKDLEKLLKLLRKQGVSDFKHGDLELKLGDLPHDNRAADDGVDPVDLMAGDQYSNFPPGMLTPEQMTFYASGGRPEDDPFMEKPIQ